MHKFTTCLLAYAFIALPSQSMAEEWRFGIGTGIGALNISGDSGFNTQVAGPIAFDASLSPSEVSDYVSSALSLAFFATKGPMTINYTYASLELEESVSGTVGAGASPAMVDLTQTSTVHDLNLEYRFGPPSQNSWSGILGAQNYEQEYEANASVSGSSVFNGSLKENWTDFYVGIKNTHAFSDSLFWSNKLTVGGGGSDSYYRFNSTVTKLLNESWAMTVALDHVDYDYEEGNRGDSDWFFYDAAETVFGVGIVYLF